METPDAIASLKLFLLFNTLFGGSVIPFF